jgi:type I restriction enzyme S subunit
MTSDWRTCTIDQIKANDDRAIAIGPFGSRMKADRYVADGVPVIRGNNISDTRTLVGDLVFVSDETADELRSCNVFPGDLVFPHRGAIGQVGIVPSDQMSRYILSTSLMKLTCNQDLVDPLFIFYFFRSQQGRHALLQNASTVGTPGIGQPLASLRSISVPVPPLPEQHAIAHILGTLDDKIELNRRMNETLEAMARALFKSWFVDFDPVRAKTEGRNPDLPKHLADFFPDSFEDSELGEIPKGWKVKTLGDMLDLVYGKALKAEDRHDGNVPVFGSNGQVGWHDERLVAGPGIIVGRKGNPGITTWVPGDFFAIDTTFYVVPTANCHSLHFLFHVLQSHDLASLGADSAVPGLNRNMAYMSTQVLPPGTLLDKFDSHASVLALRVHQSTEESRTLAGLRDTLLPKLISGELRIKDAERIIGKSM